jgi:hypothetical protein
MCFIFLAASNVILVIDLIIIPDVDLISLRLSIALVGLVMLVHGLIWEAA